MAAGAVLGALAAPAGAATVELGAVADPLPSVPSDGPSLATTTQCASAAGSPSWVVPGAPGQTWVVTRWRFRALDEASTATLRILRATAPGDCDGQQNYESVAASAPHAFAADGPAQPEIVVASAVPARAGDRLALSGTLRRRTTSGAPGDRAAHGPEGGAGAYEVVEDAGDRDHRLNLAATLESDNDADGQGDDTQDADDDNDGVPDPSDAFPLNPAESADTDGDGIGNNADGDDDNDGLADGDEPGRGTDPLRADSDGDGAGDAADNCPAASNPSQANLDLDAQGGDACDPDDDNDRLPDALEAAQGARTGDQDSDEDGLSDGEEAFLRLSAARADTDRDGLGDGVELGRRRPGVVDPPGPVVGTDLTIFRGDRDPRTRTNPRLRDSDRDRLTDGTEDANRNGLKERRETNPLRVDTDRDGIRDGTEDRNGNRRVDRTESDPIRVDTDRDGLRDGTEDRNRDGRRQRRETAAFLRDTDGDGRDDRRDRAPLNRRVR